MFIVVLQYEVKFEIPERILFMALESVLYDEEQVWQIIFINLFISDNLRYKSLHFNHFFQISLLQANNLITAMIEDDLKRQKQKEAEKAKERAERKKSPKPVRKILEIENPKSPKHEPKKTGKGKRGPGVSGISG